jgi:hypothetical protein
VAKIRKVIEEIEHDVERVIVKFLGHVQHDGTDYHAGDSAAIPTDAAAALVKAGAGAAVEPDAQVDVAPVAPADGAPAGAAK